MEHITSREKRRWVRYSSMALWDLEGPHVISYLHIFSSDLFLLFFCNGVNMGCFNACAPQDTAKLLQWNLFLFLHPSSAYLNLSIALTTLVSLSLRNVSLQALGTLWDEIIPIFTVPLHRMSIIYLQGVDRAVDQYQLLSDSLASCWESWFSHFTLWSLLCCKTKTSTHLGLITSLIPPPGLMDRVGLVLMHTNIS